MPIVTYGVNALVYSESRLLTARRILAELEIDVWVRRGRVIHEGEASAEAATGRRAPPSMAGMGMADAPVADVPVAEVSDASVVTPDRGAGFRLELLGLRCAGALVIGELPLPEDRRFARDVLGTLSGSTVDESIPTPFRWPQSSRGEQGRDAAISALEAFLRGQVERAGVHVIVLFGDVLRQLLLPDLDASEQRVQFVDAQCVLVGSTEQLRNSAERKRSLWQSILTIPAPS